MDSFAVLEFGWWVPLVLFLAVGAIGFTALRKPRWLSVVALVSALGVELVATVSWTLVDPSRELPVRCGAGVPDHTCMTARMIWPEYVSDLGDAVEIVARCLECEDLTGRVGLYAVDPDGDERLVGEISYTQPPGE